MTTRQVLGIAVKLFTIYLILSVILAIPYSISAVGINVYPDLLESKIMLVAISAVSIIVCVIALFIMWKIANSLTSNKIPEDEVTNNLSPDVFMKIILSCMGIYFSIQGILSFLEIYAQARIDVGVTGEPFTLENYYLIPAIVQFGFGITLIATPKQWVKTIRSIGTK